MSTEKFWVSENQSSTSVAPKVSDAKKICGNLPKIQTKGPNLKVFCQNGANGIVNSEDPDL